MYKTDKYHAENSATLEMARDTNLLDCYQQMKVLDSAVLNKMVQLVDLAVVEVVVVVEAAVVVLQEE